MTPIFNTNTIYRRVKEIFDNIEKEGKSKDRLIREVKHKFINQNWYTFKTYFPKYNTMGFRSRESDMLDKIVESVVGGLDSDDVDLIDFNSAISKANMHVSEAIKINRDCEEIIEKLNQIPNFLDTGKWENIDS